MTEPELNTRLQTITPPDEAARAAAHAHWASLAKPLGGLGGLETTIEDVPSRERAFIYASIDLQIKREKEREEKLKRR